MLVEAKGARALSDDHFTVDGTLLEAWASQNRCRRRDTPAEPPDDPGNPTVDFRGEARTNETHASTTDPEARLFKKIDRERRPTYNLVRLRGLITVPA